MDKNLDLSKRDIEVNNCIHAAHHDFYLLWRKQAENKVKELPFDETLYQNGGMEERPSLGHIVNCELCLKVVKRKYDAYLSIKDLQDYLGITQDEAFKNWCQDFDEALKRGETHKED